MVLAQGSIFALNGVNNVILDGRVNQTGNTADLTLINTASNPGAITVKFTGAAHHNIVKYCNLIGNDKNSNYGVVVFSGFNINNPSEGGNYNNTVSNCNITSYDTTRLRNAIYSDALFGYANRTNSIIDNNIYNFTSNSDTVCGICINGYSTDFTITGNSIYETDPVIYTSNIPRLYGIFINTAENGNNFTISGNYIGGTQTHCGGAALACSGKDGKYSEVIFKPIFLNVGSTTASSVQGNFIQNINNSNTSALIPFIGINAVSGKINIGTVIGNTIGSALANGNISVSTNSLISGSVNATSYGIFIDTLNPQGFFLDNFLA